MFKRIGHHPSIGRYRGTARTLLVWLIAQTLRNRNFAQLRENVDPCMIRVAFRDGPPPPPPPLFLPGATDKMALFYGAYGMPARTILRVGTRKGDPNPSWDYAIPAAMRHVRADRPFSRGPHRIQCD